MADEWYFDLSNEYGQLMLELDEDQVWWLSLNDCSEQVSDELAALLIEEIG